MIRWRRFPLFFSFRESDALLAARRAGEREGEDRGVIIGQLMVINDLRQMLDEQEERLRRGQIRN